MTFASEALKTKAWSEDLKKKFLAKTSSLSEYQQVDILNLMDASYDEGVDKGTEDCPDCDKCDKKAREPQHNEGMD